MFRTLLLSILAFVAGTVLIYLILVAGVFTAWELTGYRDRDGGAHMAIAFILGPLVAVPCGLVIGAITFFRAHRSKRRSQEQ